MTTRRGDFFSLLLLFALTLAMFGDVLFSRGTRVVGYPITDLYLQFLPWRDFGFRELAKGHLALWNPHIFGGAPYFGAMQAALLYPPNWLFLILPLAMAVNWSVALHVFAIGAFTFFWMRVRQLHFVASFFAAVLVMFCGAHFLHIFAGHLPHLLAMTWAPLIFCSIDGLFNQRRLAWCFAGIFAVTMQVLAGFPQHVFYTAIAAGFYSALRLIQERNWRLVPPLLGIYLGAAALSAVQLLPAAQTMRETIRGVQVPFSFAARLPFPPENIFTLFAPNFFGEPASYWGRGYLWETCLFIGITGILLAIYAAIYSDWKTKWISIAAGVFTLLLATGANTPLYRVLYDLVPGFDRFRSVSKFIFSASLFLALLAGTGLDRLLQRKRVEISYIVGVFVLTMALGCAAWWAINTDSWRLFMEKIHAAPESFLSAQLYNSSEFALRSQHGAAFSLMIAAGTCGLFATLLVVSKWKFRAIYGVVILGAAEMFWFAHSERPTFDSASVIDPDEKLFLDAHPGDYRILNRANPNSAMSIGALDLWGYDASVVRRYAEFIAWTQGADPDKATQDVNFTRGDPLYAMMRLRYILLPQSGNFQAFDSETAPLPHVQLISKYRIATTRDSIFQALRVSDFDPANEVILESEPDPAPISNEQSGHAQITSASTDSLTIEADTPQPAILLVTDVFTPSWRAVSLPGSVQANYKLQPANYILRAVPLVAGHHVLRIEYRSRELIIGAWISLAALIAYIFALFRFPRRMIRV